MTDSPIDNLQAAAIAAGYEADAVRDSPVPMINVWKGDGRVPYVTVADMGGFLCWGESWSQTVPASMPAAEAFAAIVANVG